MVVPWDITKEASNKATLFVPENKNVRRSYALKIKYGVNKHWRAESIFFPHIGTLSRISINGAQWPTSENPFALIHFMAWWRDSLALSPLTRFSQKRLMNFFVTLPFMAHSATNTERAPDPRNAWAIPTTPSALTCPLALWQQLRTTNFAWSRTCEMSAIVNM